MLLFAGNKQAVDLALPREMVDGVETFKVRAVAHWIGQLIINET